MQVFNIYFYTQFYVKEYIHILVNNSKPWNGLDITTFFIFSKKLPWAYEIN